MEKPSHEEAMQMLWKYGGVLGENVFYLEKKQLVLKF